MQHPSVLELKYTLKCTPRLAKRHGTPPRLHREEPSAVHVETGWEGSLVLTWPDYTRLRLRVFPQRLLLQPNGLAPQAGARARAWASLGGAAVEARPPQGPQGDPGCRWAATGWGHQVACRSPRWQDGGNLVSSCWLGSPVSQFCTQ